VADDLTIEQMDSISWTCPNCGSVNGTDEVTKCKCGATRSGSVVKLKAEKADKDSK